PRNTFQLSKVDRLLQKTMTTNREGARIMGSAAHLCQHVEESPPRPFHLWSAHLLWHPRTTHQQPHYKIDDDCRRNREKQGANEGRPKGGPHDPRKDMPVYVVTQSKLTKMHTLRCGAMQALRSELIFGNVNRRHRPDHYIVQGHCNRSCNLVAPADPRRTDR